MKNNLEYDVIIIGAGPGGLVAAKILAFGGKKVLILEKNKTVGEKVCGGGLTAKCLREFEIPKSIIELSFECINVYFNKKLIKLETKNPWIWTCSRKKLGEWLFKQAKDQGVEILFDQKIERINKNSVLLANNEEIFFKHLIGADGSNSVVRKYLGLKTKKIMTAMQYVVFQERSKELKVFYDVKKFGPTYAWIFPHKEFNLIGVGGDPRVFSIGVLKNNLDELCKKTKIEVSKCKLESALINYDYQGTKFGNIFLIGDAAGLTSGTTGEGIYPAMVSGKDVAKKIINPIYNFKGIKRLLKHKKIEERILFSYNVNKNLTKGLFKVAGALLRMSLVRKKLIKFLSDK